MSETVAVALIAVAGTLGSGLLSYLAARRSTQVQLKGVEAEMQRLREGHAEEHRRERQAAYYELITAMERVKQLSYGLLGPVDLDAYREVNSALGNAHTNVTFLGDVSIFESLDEMQAIFATLTGLVAEADSSNSLGRRLQDSFDGIREQWEEREAQLIFAMKMDITNARRAEQS